MIVEKTEYRFRCDKIKRGEQGGRFLYHLLCIYHGYPVPHFYQQFRDSWMKSQTQLLRWHKTQPEHSSCFMHYFSFFITYFSTLYLLLTHPHSNTCRLFVQRGKRRDEDNKEEGKKRSRHLFLGRFSHKTTYSSIGRIGKNKNDKIIKQMKQKKKKEYLEIFKIKIVSRFFFFISQHGKVRKIEKGWIRWKKQEKKRKQIMYFRDILWNCWIWVYISKKRRAIRHLLPVYE